MAKPRKSVEVLKKQGTYRKDRHESRVAPRPDPAVNAPKAPEWLAPEHVIIFSRKAREMIEMNVLTAIDVAMLAVYAALYHTISTDITKATSTMVGQLRGLANDMGFTPAARERLTVKQKPKAANEFDGI